MVKSFVTSISKSFKLFRHLKTKTETKGICVLPISSVYQT
jgi:hypothetical protein